MRGRRWLLNVTGVVCVLGALSNAYKGGWWLLLAAVEAYLAWRILRIL